MAQAKKTEFGHALELVFQGWTALQLAVEHGSGGPETDAKARWIVEATEQWFSENKNLERYEVEDFLSDIMNTEFDTIADDGSLAQISSCICECHNLCQHGRHEELMQRLGTLSKADISGCIRRTEPSIEDEESGEDDCDEPMNTSEVPPTVCCPKQPEPPAVHSDPMSCNGETTSNSPTEPVEDDSWTVVKKR